MKPMKPLRGMSSYMKNVGKSFGYVAVERFKEKAPVVSEFKETNQEIFKSVYTNVFSFRNAYSRNQDTFKRSKLFESVDEGLKNLKEDIRTGKFFDPDIEMARSSKAMGFDDSFGGDFESDFNFDSEEEVDISDKDRDLQNQMSISKSNASAISEAIANTGEAIIRNQRVSSNIFFSQAVQMSKQVNGNLEAINKNIGSVLGFANEVIKTHVENSTKFYTQTTEILNKQLLLLENINNKLIPPDDKKSKADKGITLDDVLTSSGALNLSAYKKNIKKNFDNSLLGSTLSMLGIGGDGGMNLAGAATASPMKFAVEKALNAIIPKAVDKSLASLDKSMQGFFASMLLKFNSIAQDEFSLKGQIAKLLGVNIKTSTSLDKSKYEKGKVAWTGKDSKALTEVIPSQLSEIISILSGEERKIFDYEKGEFRKSTSIRKEFNDMKNKFANRAFYDMEERFEQLEKYLKFQSKEEHDEFLETKKLLKRNTIEKQRFINPDDPETWMDLAHNKKFLSALVSTIGQAPIHEKMQLNKNILEELREREKAFEKLSEQTNTVFHSLENGISKIFDTEEDFKKDAKKRKSPFGVNLLEQKDKHGKNVFDYLRGIYTELIDLNDKTVSDTRTSRVAIGPMPQRRQLERSLVKYDKDTNKYEYREKTPYVSKEEKERLKKQRSENERFLRDQDRRLKRITDSKTKGKDFIIDTFDLGGYTNPEKTASQIEYLNHALQVEKDMKSAQKRAANPTMIDKLMKSESITGKMKTIIDQLNDISKKPLGFFTRTLDKVDQRMYEVLYGTKDGNGKTKGFVQTIVDQTKNMFAKANVWIDENLLEPLKKKLESDTFKNIPSKILAKMGIDTKAIKQTIQNFMKPFTEALKKDVKGMGNATKDAFKDTFKKPYEKAKEGFKEAKHASNIKHAEADINDIYSEDNVASRKKKKKRTRHRKKTPRDTSDDYIAKTLFSQLRKMGVNTSEHRNAIKSLVPTMLDYIDEEGNLDLSLGEYDSKSKSYNGALGAILNAKSNGHDEIFGLKNSVNKAISRKGGFKKQTNEDTLSSVAKWTAQQATQAATYYNTTETYQHTTQGFLMSINNTLDYISTVLRNKFDKNGKKPTYSKDSGLIKSLESLKGKGHNLDLSHPSGEEGTQGEEKALQTFAGTMHDNIIEALIKSLSPTSRFAKGSAGLDKDRVAVVGKGETIMDAETSKQFKDFIDRMHVKLNNGGKFDSKDKSGMNDIVGNKKFSKASIKNSLNSSDIPEEAKEAFANMAYSMSNSTGKKSKAGSFFKDLLSDTKKAFKKDLGLVSESLFGKSVEENKKQAQEFMDSGIMAEIKKHLPQMGATGAIGAIGLPILTAGILGPIGGLAVGAGIGLMKSSKNVQDYLFGKLGEDGNRKGGLIKNKTAKNLFKAMPDMKRLGIVGAVAGMMPFVPVVGPVGGLMMGAAVGFAKNNETFMESLFGKNYKERKNQFMENAMVKKLKKSAPQMLIGAGATAFLGPFGLLGNAAMGAGLGLASTSDKFRESILGKYNEDTKKYEGGLLPELRDKVVNPMAESFKDLANNFGSFVREEVFKPIKESMKPIYSMVKDLGKQAMLGTMNIVNGFFKNTFGTSLTDMVKHALSPFTRFGKKVVGKVKSGAKGLILAPVKGIKKLGEKAQAYNIRHGIDNGMSAAEKLKYRQQHDTRSFVGKMSRSTSADKSYKRDKYIASLSDTELGEVIKSLNDYEVEKDKRAQIRADIGSEISSLINTSTTFKDVGYKTRKHSLKDYEQGKASEALSQLGFSTEFDEGTYLGKILSKRMKNVSNITASNYEKTKHVNEVLAGEDDNTALLRRKVKDLLDSGQELDKATYAQIAAQKGENVAKSLSKKLSEHAEKVAKNKAESSGHMSEIKNAYGHVGNNVLSKLEAAINEGNSQKVAAYANAITKKSAQQGLSGSTLSLMERYNKKQNAIKANADAFREFAEESGVPDKATISKLEKAFVNGDIKGASAILAKHHKDGRINKQSYDSVMDYMKANARANGVKGKISSDEETQLKIDIAKMGFLSNDEKAAAIKAINNNDLEKLSKILGTDKGGSLEANINDIDKYMNLTTRYAKYLDDNKENDKIINARNAIFKELGIKPGDDNVDIRRLKDALTNEYAVRGKKPKDLNEETDAIETVKNDTGKIVDLQSKIAEVNEKGYDKIASAITSLANAMKGLNNKGTQSKELRDLNIKNAQNVGYNEEGAFKEATQKAEDEEYVSEEHSKTKEEFKNAKGTADRVLHRAKNKGKVVKTNVTERIKSEIDLKKQLVHRVTSSLMPQLENSLETIINEYITEHATGTTGPLKEPTISTLSAGEVVLTPEQVSLMSSILLGTKHIKNKFSNAERKHLKAQLAKGGDTTEYKTNKEMRDAISRQNKEMLMNELSQAKGYIKDKAETAALYGMYAKDYVGGKISSAKNYVGGKINSAKEYIKGKASAFKGKYIDPITNAIGNVMNTILHPIQYIKNKAKNAMNKILNPIKKVGKKAKDLGKAAWNKFKDWRKGRKKNKYLKSIAKNVSGIFALLAHKFGYKLGIFNTFSKKADADSPSLLSTISKAIRPKSPKLLAGAVGSMKESGDQSETTKMVNTADGLMKYQLNSKGDWVPDKSDSSTLEVLQRQKANMSFKDKVLKDLGILDKEGEGKKGEAGEGKEKKSGGGFLSGLLDKAKMFGMMALAIPLIIKFLPDILKGLAKYGPQLIKGLFKGGNSLLTSGMEAINGENAEQTKERKLGGLARLTVRGIKGNPIANRALGSKKADRFMNMDARTATAKSAMKEATEDALKNGATKEAAEAAGKEAFEKAMKFGVKDAAHLGKEALFHPVRAITTGAKRGVANILDMPNKIFTRVNKFTGMDSLMENGMRGIGNFVKNVGKDGLASASKTAVKGIVPGIKDAITNSGAAGLISKADNKFFGGKIADIAKSGVSKVSEIGKSIASKFTKTGAKDVAGAAMDASSHSGMVKTLVESVESFLKGIFNNSVVQKLIGPDLAKGFMDKAIPDFVKLFAESAAKAAPEALGKAAASIGTAGLLSIAFGVTDFISGYNNAKGNLGIVQEPTFEMKIVSGFINTLTGIVTWGLISTQAIVNFGINVIYPLCGKKNTEIQKMRAESDKVVAAYNKAHGTNLSVSQYNEKMNPSIWRRMVNFGSGVLNKVGSGISKGVGWLGQKLDQAGNWIGQEASKAGNWIGQEASQVGNWIGQKASQAGNAVANGAKWVWNKAGHLVTSFFGGADNGSGISSAKRYAPKSVMSQQNPLYKNTKFGGSTIGLNGCGPIAAVAALDDHTGQANPVEAANFAEQNGFASKYGTNEQFFDAYGRAHGMQFQKASSDGEIKRSLEQRNPVILGGKGTVYGNNNHYLVGRGMADKNNIRVLDPKDGKEYTVPYSVVKGSTQTALIGNKGGSSTLPFATHPLKNKVFKGGAGSLNSVEQKGLPSANLVYFVKQQEGYYQNVYDDCGGTPTIGYGSTSRADLAKGSVSEAEATQMAVDELVQKSHGVDNALVAHGVTNLSQNQLDALTDFAYNLGTGAFDSSTLLKVIASGQRGQAVRDQFMRWDHAGGRVVSGLRQRRAYEADMFQGVGTIPGYNTTPNITDWSTHPASRITANNGYGAKPNLPEASTWKPGANPNSGTGSTGNSNSNSSNQNNAGIFGVFNDLSSTMQSAVNSDFNFTGGGFKGKGPDAVEQKGQASSNLVYFMKQMEGFSPNVYKDSGGVATVGYGSTSKPDLAKAPVSEAEATQMLVNEMDSKAKAVDSLVQRNGLYNLNQGQFDALTDFAYNAGQGNLARSSAFAAIKAGKTGQDLRSIWTKSIVTDARGNYLAGLVKRRGYEVDMWEGTKTAIPGYNTPPKITVLGTGKYLTADNGYGAKPPNPTNTNAGSGEGGSSNSSSSSQSSSDNSGIFGVFNELSSTMQNAVNAIFGFDTGSPETSTPEGSSNQPQDTGDSSNAAVKFFESTIPGAKESSGVQASRTINGVTRPHWGIDIAAPLGSTIKSPIKGTVKYNSVDPQGFGNYLVVQDEDGYENWFGHLQHQSPLKPGTKVNRMQDIAKLGSTGRSTGPHLHYEIRKNVNGAQVKYYPNSYMSDYMQFENGQAPGNKKMNPKQIVPGQGANTGKSQGGGSQVSFSDINGKVFKDILTALLKIAVNTSGINKIVEILVSNYGEGKGGELSKEKIDQISQISRLNSSAQKSIDDMNGALSEDDKVRQEYLLNVLNTLAQQ